MDPALTGLPNSQLAVSAAAASSLLFVLHQARGDGRAIDMCGDLGYFSSASSSEVDFLAILGGSRSAPASSPGGSAPAPAPATLAPAGPALGALVLARAQGGSRTISEPGYCFSAPGSEVDFLGGRGGSSGSVAASTFGGSGSAPASAALDVVGPAAERRGRKRCRAKESAADRQRRLHRQAALMRAARFHRMSAKQRHAREETCQAAVADAVAPGADAGDAVAVPPPPASQSPPPQPRARHAGFCRWRRARTALDLYREDAMRRDKALGRKTNPVSAGAWAATLKEFAELPPDPRATPRALHTIAFRFCRYSSGCI